MATPGSPLISSRGERLEMENLDKRNKETDDLVGNKEDENTESTKLEDSLRKSLKKGKFDDITDKITPRTLTKCNTNALLMAMEVNFKLHRLARRKGSGEEDFTKLANSVGEFTSCLLDPLKSRKEARHAFGDSLDYLLEAGIEMKQKKFFTHPVMNNLMTKKWFGTFGKMKRSSLLEVGRWKWLFLNIWCLFDIFMFPFLFTMFYIKHCFNKATRRSKEMDITFIINATSDVANVALELMKGTINTLLRKYKNNHQVKFQILIHGKDDSPREISLKDGENIELKRDTEVKTPALHEDLKKVTQTSSQYVQVLVILTDHKVCERHKKEHVKEEIKKVEEKGFKIVPVGIGPHINVRELERINNDRSKVKRFGEYANPEIVGKSILHELHGIDWIERYQEYFTTPYFVFIRDTLSYLALLGLHFALCLETSSIPFSGLEWAILVFFLGRILMESRQFLGVQEQLKGDSATKKSRGPKAEEKKSTRNLRGSAYQFCGEEAEEEKGKAAIFLHRCKKYLRDRWNILDFIALLNYLVTFVLRVVTWNLSESVTDNRALVFSGYLYGLNTMFLTLRAFGHVMETFKGIGAIQIALFQIIGDVITIFWQFIATILAFSFSITKVYMAERSFISNNNGTESACKTSSGLACWWSMTKLLTWSLLGIAELDPLDSVDSTSEIIVHFLFGTFLVVGVILLVNMMIAILSNTYQRVQDNSLKEWSFKKAITIQTYSTYHPIPVPLNLISQFFLLTKWLCLLCARQCCKRQPETKNCFNKTKSLDGVVETLENEYFSRYGYSFPLTDETKMDHVLQETAKSRQMANHIAYTTFAAHGGNNGIFPTGPQAWRSQGIRIHGNLLICEGSAFCSTCKDDPFKYHGASYKCHFSPDFPHFEVLIQETGNRRLLGVGVVESEYGNHAMPGWRNGTVGYHIDDGRIFDENNPEKGVECEDAMAYRGDLVSCTVKFDLAKNGKVPIVFYLNGRQIDQDNISMKYTGREKLYPYIGMGHKGIRVLAKMTSHQHVDENVKIIDFQDAGLPQQEELDSIMETLEGMESKFKSSFQEIDEAFRDLNIKIDEGNGRFNGLVNEILTNFDDFERKRGPPKLGLMMRRVPCASAPSEYLPGDMDYLSKKDKENASGPSEYLPGDMDYLSKKDKASPEPRPSHVKVRAAPPRRYLPGDIDFLSRIDITTKFRDFKRRLFPTEEDEIINDDLDEKCQCSNACSEYLPGDMDYLSKKDKADESVILPSEVQQLSKIDIPEVTDEERPSEKQREIMDKDVVGKMEYLCKQDSPKRRLIDKIDQIERMTDENFKAVFDAFLQTTGMSQRHNDEQEEFRGEVQKRFNELEEFIRDYFE